MATSNDITIGVTADSKGVQSGLAPAITSLDKLGASAAKTDKQLDALAATKIPPVQLTVRDEAIKAAKAKIETLRDQIARGVVMGVDTKDAQKQLRALESTVKQLDKMDPTIEPTVTGVGRAKAQLAGLTAATDAAGFSGLSAVKGLGPLGLVAALGTLEVKASQTAAGMETMRISLKNVIRDGGDVNAILKDIQEFGNTTPFEFPELVETAKILVSMGVSSSDLLRTMKDLGAVAAAATVPISDVATIYGQMLAKGKIQQEDMLQLIQRGIPAWTALAQATGKSEAELQELAAQGKLTRTEVEAMGKALGQMFPNSISEQAASVNGQMSTLNDNMSVLGDQMGSVINPMLNQFLGTLNKLLANDLVKGGLTGLLVGPVFTIPHLVKEFDKLINGTEVLTAKTKPMTAASNDAAAMALAASKDWRIYADATDEARKGVEGLTKGLDILNGNALDAREAARNYEKGLDDLAEALKLNGKTLDVGTEKGRANQEALDNQASALEALTEAQLNDARVNGKSTTDILANYGKQRQALITMAQEFGMTKTQAQNYVDTLLATPTELTTEVQLSGLDAARKGLSDLTDPKQVSIAIKLAENEDKRLLKKLDALESGWSAGPDRSSGSSSGTAPKAGPQGFQLGQSFVDARQAAVRGLGGMADVPLTAPRPSTSLNTFPGMPSALASSGGTPAVHIHVSDKRLADLFGVEVRNAATSAVRGLSTRKVVQVGG